MIRFAEAKIYQILTNTYENVKANVNIVTEKMAKTASKILEKSAKLIRKYQTSRKNKKRRKQNDDDGSKDTFTASTSRRQYKNGQNHG
jgi:hypothetical protein